MRRSIFLICSVRIYQRIIKLKYLSHMFSCNKPMCLCKRQTHVSNYYKFQLSSDIEKNPGPTPVYIAPYQNNNGTNEFMPFDLQ